MPEVILYSRPHCGLCDEAMSALRPLAARLAFTLVERNVDEDPRTRVQYGDVIPVVEVDGSPLVTAPFDPAELEDLLRPALKAG